MINQSMLPIFNKISDLFKSKVYVDSGPLEQNIRSNVNNTQEDKEKSSAIANNNKTVRNNHKGECSNMIGNKLTEEFDTNETNKFSNSTGFHINTNNQHSPHSQQENAFDLKREFNVYKINLNYQDSNMG